MKKFFSMMALTMIALTMVSCGDKDENTTTSEENTRTTTDLRLVVAVTDNQATAFDQTYTVTIGSTKKTVKLSEMTEFAEGTTYGDFCSDAKSMRDVSGGTCGIKYYMYDFGQQAVKASVTFSCPTTVKADHVTEGTVALFACADIYEQVSGKYTTPNNHTNIGHYYGGIKASEEETLTLMATTVSGYSGTGTIY